MKKITEKQIREIWERNKHLPTRSIPLRIPAKQYSELQRFHRSTGLSLTRLAAIFIESGIENIQK